MNLEQEGISEISLLLQASHIWRTYPRRCYQLRYPPTLILSWIDYPICIVSVLLQAFNVQMKIFSSTCVDLALCRLTQIISLKTLFITAAPCQTTSLREDVSLLQLLHLLTTDLPWCPYHCFLQHVCTRNYYFLEERKYVHLNEYSNDCDH